MHPLSDLAHTTLEQIKASIEKQTDPSVAAEFAAIGVNVALMTEGTEHIMHILAHVPMAEREKAIELTRQCDEKNKEVADTLH